MFEKSTFFGAKPAPGEQQASGLFHAAAPVQLGAQPPEVLQQLRDVSRRLRTLEERALSLRKTIQIHEQDVLGKHKKVTMELKSLADDLVATRKDMKNIQEKLMLLVGELQQFARKDDVLVLKKYINLWEPIQFVTRNEVQRLVDAAVTKALAEQEKK